MNNIRVKKTRIVRTISWEGETNELQVSIRDYEVLMKEYGEKKAKTIRTSRKYLRSLGLEVNRYGEILSRFKNEE